ncbi:sentrin-specific protease 8 [Aplysia californica]|uniref:Sentrin-specific protease 8 n=1 Tax=Aplysia californica TaxID=6500 RepID=A0ABM1W1D7_APLCA|nr:sentrin-specific protease 8 [Aplysia californica]
MADEDEIVLSFGDSLLRKSDLNLLNEPNWINDKIIAFCFEYYEHEQFNHSADKMALISPAVAQLMRFASGKEGMKEGMSERRKIDERLVPARRDTNDLYCVDVCFSFLKQRLSVVGVGSGENSCFVSERLTDIFLCRFLSLAPRGKLKFVEMDCPQQQNGYDCGMYVIAMTEHLIRELCECFGVSLPEMVNADTVQRLRGQILSLVEKLRQSQEHSSVAHHNLKAT